MNIAIYVVAAAIGLLLSSMSMVFALLSGLLFAFLVGACLVAAHIGALFLARKKALEDKVLQAALVLVLPLPAVMAALYIVTICVIAISALFEH